MSPAEPSKWLGYQAAHLQLGMPGHSTLRRAGYSFPEAEQVLPIQMSSPGVSAYGVPGLLVMKQPPCTHNFRSSPSPQALPLGLQSAHRGSKPVGVTSRKDRAGGRFLSNQPKLSSIGCLRTVQELMFTLSCSLLSSRDEMGSGSSLSKHLEQTAYGVLPGNHRISGIPAHSWQAETGPW